MDDGKKSKKRLIVMVIALYVVYEKNGSTFSGRITVGDKAIGPSSSDGDGMPYVVDNCSFGDGCEVVFTHKISRQVGSDETDYRILNASNNDSIITMGNTQNGSLVYTERVKLYLGETVCEALSFRLDSTSSDYARLKICAVAEGQVSSSINIKQKKDTIENDFAETDIYAKPGDKVLYQVEYNAGAQVAYSKLGKAMPEWNPGWNNAFIVTGVFDKIYSRNTSGALYNENYAIGNGGIKVEIFEKSITENEVGEVLVEKAVLNPAEDSARTTPTWISYDENWDIRGETLESSVLVKVPYNFESSVAVGDIGDISERVGTEILELLQKNAA